MKSPAEWIKEKVAFVEKKCRDHKGHVDFLNTIEKFTDQFKDSSCNLGR